MTQEDARTIAIRLATDMAAALPLQGTPAGCFDTCWGAAHDLNAVLEGHGVGGKVIMLKGWLGGIDLPQTGNHREWLRMGQHAWTHWIIRIGDDLYIDPTARQFDGRLGHPQIDDHECLARRWAMIDRVSTLPEREIIW